MHRPELMAIVAGTLLALPFGGGATTAPDVVRLAIDGRSNTASSIAAQGDLVAVAWNAALPTGGGDVFVAVSRDGATSFGTPVRVNDVEGEARGGGELPPRIALGPAKSVNDADMIVVWRARQEQTSIRLARSIDGGRTFDSTTTLQSAEAAGERGWHSGAIAPDGQVHALWLDHRGLAPAPGATPHVRVAHRGDMDGAAMAQRSGLYYAAWSNGSATERELAKGVCFCCKTSLATGANGRVYAAWRHVYPGNIRDIAFITSRDGGRTFAAPSRVSEDGWQLAGCPDDGPAMVVGADQRVHLVWPTVIGGADPEGALFYASTLDGQAFTTRRRIPTLGSPRPTHPQIAITARDEVMVAWDEVMDGTRRASMLVMQARPAGGTTFSRPIMLDPTGPPSVYPMLAVAGPRVVAAWTSGSGAAAVIAVRRVDPGVGSAP